MSSLQNFAKNFLLSAFSLLILFSISARAVEEPIPLLAKAIKAGDLAKVRKIIGSGIDVNVPIPTDSLGATPLHFAVRENKLEIVRVLLEAGADSSLEDENGDTAMTSAADREHIAIARLLIEKGTSIDSKNSKGITALMREVPYEEKDDTLAKIELGASLELTDPNRRTALLLAAARPNLGAMEALLDAGADPNAADHMGRTPLMAVLTSDFSEPYTKAITLLLSRKANPDLRDKEGKTALMLAFENWQTKSPAILALLKTNPDISFKNTDGEDALFQAYKRKSDVKVIARLIEMGADVMTTDPQGTTLLMLAAENLDMQQVDFLLEKGLSAEAKRKDGKTAVHFALLSAIWSNDPFKDSEPEGSLIVSILKKLHSKAASLT